MNIKIEAIRKKRKPESVQVFLFTFSDNKKKRKLLPFFMFIILESEFFWILELKFPW